MYIPKMSPTVEQSLGGGGESTSAVAGAELISIYLAGEDKSTKNVPATTESTI